MYILLCSIDPVCMSNYFTSALLLGTSPHVWSEKFQPGVHTLSIVPYSGSRRVGSPASTEFEEGVY